MKHSAADWARAVIVPGPGNGTLARVGPVVLLVGSSDPEVVRPYLDHAEMVAANGGQGRQLVRGYAVMLSTAVEQSPGFAALAPHTTGLAVFVDGDVTVTVDDEVISGAGSLAWVERLVPWPVDRVSVTLPGTEPANVGLPYRLDAGVVPAGSFALGPGDVPEASDADTASADVTSELAPVPAVAEEPMVEAVAEPAAPVAPEPPAPQPPAPEPSAPAAPAPAPAPPPPVAGRPLPPPPADEQVSFQSVLLDDLEDDDFEPLPIVDDPSVIEDVGAAKEEVRGVYCKNRHFNDPRQMFCAVCGINMVQQTPVLVNGTRPPLGVIVLDDGAVFQLDSAYLLGRDPGADERVRSEQVRGIAIQDQSNQISRVHARIELRGWDPVLIDNHSTNGTFVTPPKATQWIRLSPGGEHVLTQGTRVRIGHRTLAFNTHAGQ